ncbi:MAG: Por secretion system protein [Prevotella sp.]|nr:Por secretion system protein [Prevotella sp.]
MKTLLTNILLLTALNLSAQKIGQWNAYMAYGDITDIEPAGNMVYVLSSGSLFSYNINDKSINIYNKVYPLNDTEISHIAWCNDAKRLVIIYSNQNIDLLDNSGNVTNINDYYNKSMTEDKTVNNITIIGNNAYLSTGFGILKINVKDEEINNTYNLGINVTDCAVKGNTIYAKTSYGIYEGNMSNNLLDKNNWNITSSSVSFNDANDITTSTLNGYTEYIKYDNINKCYWSNQQDGKLQGYKIDNDNVKTVIAQDINPDGPKYNFFGFLKIHENKLYSCNGGMWDVNNPASIQVLDFENEKWTTYNNEGISEKYGIDYKDVLTLDIDPFDSKRVVAGTKSGLFEFYDGEIRNYWNDKNSPIYYIGELKDYRIITSVIFDGHGDLWIANSGSSKNTILKLNADNTWTIPNNTISTANSANLKFMDFNANSMLWLFSNYYEHPAAYLYDPATETKNEYSNFINEDGAKFENVIIKAMAKDKDGNIWVGINQGLLVLTKEYQNDPSKGFYQIKVPRNDGTNLADYLLSGIDITAIAIDNANRKWIGTSGNGLYLISEDNMVEVEHFTTTNSSIISNNILYIAIDKSGKVYIGTDKGLCSYQSEASVTNDDMNKDNVWAYPNPVRPDYTGLITITGLSFNADVKITTSNGVLVAQGHSTGGSFQWDGNDLKGKRVASGIYMVNTATENGGSGTVCKIAIIN